MPDAVRCRGIRCRRVSRALELAPAPSAAKIPCLQINQQTSNIQGIDWFKSFCNEALGERRARDAT